MPTPLEPPNARQNPGRGRFPSPEAAAKEATKRIRVDVTPKAALTEQPAREQFEPPSPHKLLPREAVLRDTPPSFGCRGNG